MATKKAKTTKQELVTSYKTVSIEDDMSALKREAYYYSIPTFLDLKSLKEEIQTKADDVVATTQKDGLLSAKDKEKLDNLDPNKEFVHPTNDGNRHLPPTGSTNGGKFIKAGNTPGDFSWENIRWSDVLNKPTTVDDMGLIDAAKVGHKHSDYASSNHTHPKATNRMDGLLSKEDKQKLDSIQQGAANQNTFSHIKVEDETLSADTASATLELAAGEGITLTADPDLDRITVKAEGLASKGHTHPNYAQKDHTHNYASMNHNHDNEYANINGATFTGEVDIPVLKIGGRRIFIQSTTPSMAKDGDIWLKF